MKTNVGRTLMMLGEDDICLKAGRKNCPKFSMSGCILYHLLKQDADNGKEWDITINKCPNKQIGE